MSENKRPSARQQRAIEALITEPTTRAAAKAAKVSEATIWRWLTDPIFSTAYKDARSQLLESTLTALQAKGQAAVEALADVMTNAVEYPSARVSAARTILEMTLKAREVLEVEERLREVEAKLAAQTAPAVKRGL